MAYVAKEYSDNYAYDLSRKVITKGEIWDDDVIKQSVESIVATYFGERLFNLKFGSPLWGRLFENMTPSDGESILNGVSNAIKRWEDRVRLIENEMRLTSGDDNSLILIIPFVIKRTGKKSIWQKKIYM